MKPQLRTNRGFIGNELFIRFPDVSSYPRTILTADSTALSTSMTSLDASFLSQNDYILIGQRVTPQAEVQQFNSATNSTVINLVGSITFPHEQSTEVHYIPFNQVIIERSTDGGVTFSTLATQNLRPSLAEHYYLHSTGAATDYYRCRFYNSTTLLSTDPSDSVIATGYADNTVFAIKNRALAASGLRVNDIYQPDSIITDQMLNDALFEARRIVHSKRRRWNFRQRYNYILGQVVGGTQRIALPTDMEDTNSMKNLYSVRIGGARTPLLPITKSQWNDLQFARKHTTLASAITSTGQTTITLTNAGDFDLTGSISMVDAGVLDTPLYTTNTRSTNILSGVTSISSTHAAGLDVWQNPTFGLPVRYTVFNGYIYFDIPISLIYQGESIFIDYYSTITAIDSDGDVLDEPKYDMFVPYLKWRIRQTRNQGTMAVLANQDPDYEEFESRLEDLILNDSLDRDLRFQPDIPDISDDYLM